MVGLSNGGAGSEPWKQDPLLIRSYCLFLEVGSKDVSRQNTGASTIRTGSGLDPAGQAAWGDFDGSWVAPWGLRSLLQSPQWCPLALDV